MLGRKCFVKESESVERITYVDLRQVNCWHVNWKMNEIDTENEILQKNCLINNRFGIAWDITDKGRKYKRELLGKVLEKNNQKIFKRAKKQDKRAMLMFEYLQMVRSGDYVMGRLSNSHIVIGKVSDATVCYNDNFEKYPGLSWYCCVERWVEICYEEKVPAELLGRLTMRWQGAIAPVRILQQKLMMIRFCQDELMGLDEDEEESRSISKIFIPKQTLTKDNFVRILKYEELEDLVYYYMCKQKENKGYQLLPSSCKASRKRYEFVMFHNEKKKKSIACQVKNQAQIEVEDYIDEMEYDRIYLFSGLWTQEMCMTLREKYRNYSHICFLDSKELFESFRNFTYMWEKVTKDKEYCVEEIDLQEDRMQKVQEHLENNGWRENKKSIQHNSYKRYCINGDNIRFSPGWQLYYSAEYNALICADKEITENKVIELKEILKIQEKT